ncbi:hypothetical protein BCR43DRAFT_506213 [Syncephalastrum racemosum]|uniref:Galactose oxidase n=1 Tax=Syncephalastrum racemosum TaxID=13706 RepID=A0A1X2HAW2_SYNRA|nr:hypothetical protein BCR43DRAFT_506213 [Syncephalastrum racemosum]
MTLKALNAADSPTPRAHSTLSPMGNQSAVLLYGGEPLEGNAWDPHFYVLQLSHWTQSGPSQAAWSRIPQSNLPAERSNHSVAHAPNVLYFWGGQRNGQFLSDMFYITTDLSEGLRWDYIIAKNEGPAGRAGHVSVVFDNKLFIFGGTDGDHLYNDIWTFDLQTLLWKQVAAAGYIPVPREGCSASLVGDVMYVFGGRGPDGRVLGDLCAFKMAGHRWFSFQNMGPSPSPRADLSFTTVHNNIVALSGVKDDHSAYLLNCSRIRYPPSSNTSSRSPSRERLQSPTQPARASPSPDLIQQQQQPQQSEEAQSHTPITRVSPSPDPIKQQQQQQQPLYARPQSHYPAGSGDQPPVVQRPPRHVSMMIPEAALRRPRTASPLPNTPTSAKDESQKLPARATMVETPQGPPPQRPPRPSVLRKREQDEEEIIRQIKEKDIMIQKMKQSEGWWRQQVSLARRVNRGDMQDHDADESMLMDLSDTLSDEKTRLYENLVSLKAELRRSKSVVEQRAHTLRTAALQEAAYFKSKCAAVAREAPNPLEKQLAEVLAQNEQQRRQLRQQRLADEEHARTRSVAEERAREAHERASEATAAHERALLELEKQHTRASAAQALSAQQAREMAYLESEIAASADIHKAEAEAKVARLQEATQDVRAQVQNLEGQLAQQRNELGRLQALVNERDDAVRDVSQQLEAASGQLGALKAAMTEHGLAVPATRAY